MYLLRQIMFHDKKPLVRLSVYSNNEPQTYPVNEADTLASLINACKYRIRHCCPNNAMRVMHNGVDLTTLIQTTGLADLDIDETSILSVEPRTGHDSNRYDITVKTIEGDIVSITDANANW
jgi:hypothetical protein